MDERPVSSMKRSAALGVEETAGVSETRGVPQKSFGQVIGYLT